MGFLSGLMNGVANALTGASLEEASKSSPASPGVYKIYLDGRLMKIGKAEWKAGIRWRMQQYWRGDSTAGFHGAEIYRNRSRIRVTWTLCSADECRRVEVEQQEQAGGIANLPWCERS